MTDEERLQAHLNLMRGEPLIRLTGSAAMQQALKLRALGLTYRSLKLVMGSYHGEWYSEYTWRAKCVAAGAARREGNFRGRPAVKP